MIGSLGEIIFIVSSKKVSTFNNLSEDNSGKWETHTTKKQEQEFISSELAKCTITIPTNMRVGTSPDKTYDLLNNYCSTGEVINFILGGKKFRNKSYILRSFKTTDKQIDNIGQIISADYEVQLEEYGGDRKVNIIVPTSIKSNNTYKKSEPRKNNIDYKTGGTY